MAQQYSVDIVAKALGGAQVDKLADSFRGVDRAAAQAQKGADGATNGIRALRPAAGAAATGMQGLGAAIQAALGPILAVSTAITVLKKGIDTAFERGAAEQKLRNFTDSAGEYSAALAVASDSARKFGISQTEATAALGDVYGRLKGLGFGLKETSEIYQGFNAIAMQSGATAEDASGAFLQLSQALGSGKLQGDELRAVMERLPQLGQAIAQSMGVSAAELRKLGQEGKLTSEEIYKALAQAAAGAGELGNKLNEQQSAFKTLGQVSDQLLNSIGQVFGPAVTIGAQLLAEWGQKLADWWGYLGDQVFPKVVSAVEPLRAALANAFKDIDIGAITSFLQNVLIKGFQFWLGVIGNVAKALAGVVNWFKQLSQNPIIQTLVNTMGALVEKLGLGGSKVQEWKVEQDKVTAATAATVSQYSNLPPKIDDAKNAAKELKAAVDEVKQSYELQNGYLDRQVQALTNRQQLEAAQNSLQQALNDGVRQRLEYELEGAKTAEQRGIIVKALLDNELKGAKLKMEAQKAQNLAALASVNIEKLKAEILLSQYQMQLRLTAAKGGDTSELAHQVSLQQQVVGKLGEQADVAEQIRLINDKTADAMLRQAEFSARVTAEKRMQEQINRSSSSGSVNSADASIINYLNGINRRGGADMGNVLAWFNRLGKDEQLKQAQAAGYANGGYVTGPTNAMIGEGGEPEYVIPASKMGTAMARYASGARGGSVIPQVNVAYNGTTVSMGGQDYISRKDVPGLLSAAVSQTVASLNGSPRMRKAAGIR